MSEKLSCVVCRRPMPNILSKNHQPSGGLAFFTYGHYGSAYFDPMDGVQYLQLSICDECVEQSDKAGLVYHGEHTEEDRKSEAERAAALAEWLQEVER